eukprot:g46810.t1
MKHAKAQIVEDRYIAGPTTTTVPASTAAPDTTTSTVTPAATTSTVTPAATTSTVTPAGLCDTRVFNGPAPEADCNKFCCNTYGPVPNDTGDKNGTALACHLGCLCGGVPMGTGTLTTFSGPCSNWCTDDFINNMGVDVPPGESGSESNKREQFLHQGGSGCCDRLHGRMHERESLSLITSVTGGSSCVFLSYSDWQGDHVVSP